MQQSEMIQEKRIETLEQLAKYLDGRRIFAAGLHSALRQEFVQNLTHTANRHRIQYTVSERMEEVGRRDLVFLFGAIDVNGSESFRQLDELMKQLEQLKEYGPEAIVLVSDSRVYGKRFGEMQPCRETDMGYVCHTVPAEMELQCMRMAEHLACRMAREESLAIRIVRTESGLHGDAAMQMIAAALRVLLWGRNGEIYNLPAAGRVKGQEQSPERTEETVLTWQENRSPLSPMRTVTDTGKLEELN